MLLTVNGLCAEVWDTVTWSSGDPGDNEENLSSKELVQSRYRPVNTIFWDNIPLVQINKSDKSFKIIIYKIS